MSESVRESIQEPPSLFEHVQELAQAHGQPFNTLVSFDDFAIYYLLATEIARIAADDCANDHCLMVDSQTARQVDAVDNARAKAASVHVFGAVSSAWSGLDNVTVCGGVPQTDGRDLFLVLISPGLSLALVCKQGNGSFRGLWTGQRSQVTAIAQHLLSAHGVTPVGPLASLLTRGGSERTSLDAVMRLTAMLSRQLTLRQRDMATDRDELFSVLEILKAISTERRAHDILYVFVEQIAKAVHMDRCSVVRVWDRADKGLVLASHEDESVTELPIDLSKYPEIQRAIETRSKVVINDAQHDPLTRGFAEDLVRARVNAILVVPLVLFEQSVGTLLLRAARGDTAFSLREISFCEIVAGAAANALERAHLFESIQEANERLERLAVTDGLTGLYNHRFLRQRLEDEFERARRYSLPLSCMMLDVDNFKKVNDTYGHLKGDSVLRQIAKRTVESVRKSDVVARYGGEELFVIMPQTGLKGAKAQAERVRKKIAHHPFAGLPEDAEVTVSVGVSVFDPERTLDCEALIRAADGALYRSKARGKNLVTVGEP